MEHRSSIPGHCMWVTPAALTTRRHMPALFQQRHMHVGPTGSTTHLPYGIPLHIKRRYFTERKESLATVEEEDMNGATPSPSSLQPVPVIFGQARTSTKFGSMCITSASRYLNFSDRLYAALSRLDTLGIMSKPRGRHIS
ncbi:unnamed protein product [Phytophthora fragariaefolia]|uniref:Unnamed protein product n=1 Tax=Phytophthora fragariaefolia TaxID=1490495 RepID=A0A9W6X6A3_9STRA|nr:unnamed protein product [Phytophthora fragariaefolia]